MLQVLLTGKEDSLRPNIISIIHCKREDSLRPNITSAIGRKRVCMLLLFFSARKEKSVGNAISRQLAQKKQREEK